MKNFITIITLIIAVIIGTIILRVAIKTIKQQEKIWNELEIKNEH